MSLARFCFRMCLVMYCLERRAEGVSPSVPRIGLRVFAAERRLEHPASIRPASASLILPTSPRVRRDGTPRNLA